MGLVVDTKIPYGNACDVCATQDANGWTVSFAADPHGGPESLWFCFRLRWEDQNSTPIGKVKLVLRHLENMLGGSAAEKIWPVVRQAGGDWQRLAPGAPEPIWDGRCLATWTVEVAGPYMDVAACYPYGMPDVEALVSQTGGYWRADTIGVSQGSRPLVRLSNGAGAAGSDRLGLYLAARQHSGETPGSWVLDGFLRQMATQGEKAPLIWAIPLMNIDGVEQGDYGKDNFPYDLNRAWGSPPMRHEVLVFQRDIRRWRKRCRPVLALDFHAPGLCEDDGSYAFLSNGRMWPGASEAGREWAERMAKALGEPYASSTFARSVNYPSRWEMPTFSAYFAGLGICGFSLETPYGSIAGHVLTREDYQRIGERLSQCVLEHMAK